MSASEAGETRAAFEAALALLATANDSAVEAVRANASPQEAFELATQLADALRVLADSAADVRAEAVVRIYDHESLSLAGLAGRIGVSKARAGQLIQNAKKGK